MAYGKNKDRKDWQLRALPLAVGHATQLKQDALTLLQSRIITLMHKMVRETFVTDPLFDPLDSKALDARLVALQKSSEDLNAVWAEQARMRVKPALEESYKRYFKRLVGSLRFVDTPMPDDDVLGEPPIDFVGPPAPRRRYVHVPLAVQDDITAGELDALKRAGASGKAIAIFEQVIVRHDDSGMSTAQVAVIRAIHAKALEKHRMPEFGADDRFTLQLHLDYRMLPSVKRKGLPDKPSEALQVRAGEAYLLEDNANTRYTRFIDIAGVAPRDPRIRVPVVLTKRMALRMAGTRSDWSSLIIELTSHKDGKPKVGVRLVCGKPPAAIDTTNIRAIVGRDFGYANTISLSVAVSDTPIDIDTAEIREQTKQDAKAYFEANGLPADTRVVERVKFEGRRFLARINGYCTRIDSYKSRLDLAYNELWKVRSQIGAELKLPHDASITADLKNSEAGDLVRCFFSLYGQIKDLKEVRRGLYRKIASIKKNWFGFLSNFEVMLARKYNAAIVRENLTVEAIEKESPQYKGRLFNKMLNNGAKGQYQRMASQKHEWNGIPEVAIPSWYTSRACTTHSTVIEKRHRKGESIFLPCCNRRDHADLHASDTIAQYLLLTPRVTAGASLSRL
jgi:hypothetical protein